MAKVRSFTFKLVYLNLSPLEVVQTHLFNHVASGTLPVSRIVDPTD